MATVAVRNVSRALMGILLVQIGLVTVQAQDFSYRIRKAIFSQDQFFWPGLAADLNFPPPTIVPSTRLPPLKHAVGGVDSSGSAARLGVLPIQIHDYAESKPCDSCHRLSANGMEFYLENYFKDKLAHRFPKSTVELIAPQFALLENQKIDLMPFLDGLKFPWAKWFGDSSEALLYRPRDWMIAKDTRKHLDRLGGLLHQDYLLIPSGIHIFIRPLISSGHTGGFEWKFSLVFWNVLQSRVEWAFLYTGEAGRMDLDKSLNQHLDKALGAAWDGLPGELTAQLQAEQH